MGGNNKTSFQLRALRANVDADEKPLDNNYRPTQALNGRSIEHFEAGAMVAGAMPTL